MIFSDNQIVKISKVFQRIYIFIMVVGIIGLAIVALIYFFLETNLFNMSFPFFIGILTAYCLYWGFKHRKGWVPPVMIFLSSLGLIYGIFSALTSQPVFNFQITYYAWIVIRLLIWLVQLFALYFFAKKEVRNFFNSKRVVIF